MENFKIGILGSGIVGQTLGNGFVKHGYQVMLGSRNPVKLNEWKVKSGNIGLTGNYSDTAKHADIIVLAVKGSVANEVLSLAGYENIKGKIIIDATNPIADDSPEKGVLKFFTNLDSSLMEQLQKKFPEVKFVKAFSCIGAHYMVNPDFGGQKPTMFICGNNKDAKQEVSKILDLFGFDVEDMGDAVSARAIEPLCILWCIPGILKNEWSHAFKLLKN